MPAETLAPPGAGIPALERWFVRFFAMPLASRRVGWQGSIGLFRHESDRLLALASALDADTLRRPVLIPRLPGLEDSSRRWSPLDVLEHLENTMSGMSLVISELAKGRSPGLDIRTENVKPAQIFAALEAATALQRFEAAAHDTIHRVEGLEAEGRLSRARQPHPWFGPMSAADWVWLLGQHQRLHRKQMEAILQLRNSQKGSSS